MGFPDTAGCSPYCCQYGGHHLVRQMRTRIYLILFATYAFVSQRQGRPSWMPSLLGFRSISTDFTPTPTVPPASNALYSAHLFRSFKVKPWKFNGRCGGTPTDSLRPINPDNAWGTRITATAGTSLVTPYSWNTVISYNEILLPEKLFTSRRTSSSTRRRWFRVSPIDQYSRLLPPVGVWAMFQSHCWRSCSHTAYPS